LTKYIVQGGKPLFGEIEVSGAKNAAVLAAQILAVADDELAAKLDAARVDMAQQIAAKEAKLQAELA
jgi:5-(carboxyamino)imidazole ribonucleotide mutase